MDFITSLIGNLNILLPVFTKALLFEENSSFQNHSILKYHFQISWICSDEYDNQDIEVECQ